MALLSVGSGRTTAVGNTTAFPSCAEISCVTPGALAVSIWVSAEVGLQASFEMFFRRVAASRGKSYANIKIFDNAKDGSNE